jgi:asparagine synthase (glutamine-hydrolysing)
LSGLAGLVPGIASTKAINAEGSICVLDSSLYLRNQLLRDSDWASMAHSLELRTPLVDSLLLNTLKSFHTRLKGGAGKRLLASSPLKALPAEVLHRPKTGFAVPMTEWLRKSTELQNWGHSPYLIQPGTPWTRSWACIVADSFLSSVRRDRVSFSAI